MINSFGTTFEILAEIERERKESEGINNFVKTY